MKARPPVRRRCSPRTRFARPSVSATPRWRVRSGSCRAAASRGIFPARCRCRRSRRRCSRVCGWRARRVFRGPLVESQTPAGARTQTAPARSFRAALKTGSSLPRCLKPPRSQLSLAFERARKRASPGSAPAEAASRCLSGRREPVQRWHKEPVARRLHAVGLPEARLSLAPMLRAIRDSVAREVRRLSQRGSRADRASRGGPLPVAAARPRPLPATAKAAIAPESFLPWAGARPKAVRTDSRGRKGRGLRRKCAPGRGISRRFHPCPPKRRPFARNPCGRKRPLIQRGSSSAARAHGRWPKPHRPPQERKPSKRKTSALRGPGMQPRRRQPPPQILHCQSDGGSFPRGK